MIEIGQVCGGLACGRGWNRNVQGRRYWLCPRQGRSRRRRI